jgi:hypothetical protein
MSPRSSGVTKVCPRHPTRIGLPDLDSSEDLKPVQPRAHTIRFPPPDAADFTVRRRRTHQRAHKLRAYGPDQPTTSTNTC